MGYFNNDPGVGHVDIADIAFAYHALTLVIITGI